MIIYHLPPIKGTRNSCWSISDSYGQHPWMAYNWPAWSLAYNQRIFQQTPGTYPRPPTNSLWRNSFHLGFGDAWGMLQGYVGVLFDIIKQAKIFQCLTVNMVWQTWLVVEPTHLQKYARQNGFIFPCSRSENQTIFELQPPSLLITGWPFTNIFCQVNRPPSCESCSFTNQNLIGI